MGAHPLEQLRYLARGWGSSDDFPAREAAEVLAQLAAEIPGSLVQACRRLIEYFPSSGPAWWLCARALCAPDPVEGILGAAGELADDPTGLRLAEALPASGVVAAPELSGAVRAALRRRQDVQVQKKAVRAQMVVVPVLAAGPSAVLVRPRSATAARSAAHGGKPVWAVVARGSLLPGPLWEQLLERAGAAVAVELALEVIEAGELGGVVGERGLEQPLPGLSRATCPPVAELLGWGS
jgi:hypothetical protein